MLQADQNQSLARVRGRSIGSLFFSVFGALWLALSLFAFGSLTHRMEVLLATFTFAFAGVALRLLRAVPRAVEVDPQRKRDGRLFGWVNAAQWVAVFVVLRVANRLHHPDAAFPLIVFIVGLHFFALPRSYRVRSNLVTGAVLILAAAVCPLLFRGDAMVGAVALCAGLTLWCSATYALGTASILLRASRNRLHRTAPMA